MKIKVSLQIYIKLFIIIIMIIILPTYSYDTSKVFKAINASNTSSSKVHIYNTHQSEKYIDYDVLQGANYLMNKLNSIGIYCDVEENDFEHYKNIHSISYNQSYTVSKMYLETALKENGQYDLIIDFHRDSLDKKYSTLKYNNKSYAKVLFVVGKSSGKYDDVYALSKQLSDAINQQIPNLSKGIMVKKNHYNQGISNHSVLIEFGGVYNTKEEVNNTIDVITLVIGDYLK